MSHSLECLIAHSPEERSEVFRLRYTSYRRDGSIPPHPSEMFCDHFDGMPNHFSFLVRAESGDPMATVRISVVRPDLDWTDSPGRHVYGDHPALHAIASESYVEASRLCFGRQARRDAFVRLVGHMAALADFYDVKWLVACPRLEHVPVYERMFGFSPLAAPRQYYGVAFQTQLLAIAREDLRMFIKDAKPMTQAWTEALSRMVTAVSGGLLLNASC